MALTTCIRAMFYTEWVLNNSFTWSKIFLNRDVSKTRSVFLQTLQDGFPCELKCLASDVNN